MDKCDRCGADLHVEIMSVFNTDRLCIACYDKERAHPKYEEAVKAENAAVRHCDYNFPGIGKPGDL